MPCPCPFDASAPELTHTTKTVSGAGRDPRGRDYYRYSCTCGREWKQIRVDKLDPGERPTIVDMGPSGVYTCGVCGQRKRGHICTGQPRAASQALSVASPPPPTTLPMPDVTMPTCLVSMSSLDRRKLQLMLWQMDRPGIEWNDERISELNARVSSSRIWALRRITSRLVARRLPFITLASAST